MSTSPTSRSLENEAATDHREATSTAPCGLQAAPCGAYFLHTHRIHGAAIYANIYHQYSPVMLAYIYIYQHHGSVMGYFMYHRIFTIAIPDSAIRKWKAGQILPTN